MCDESDLIYKPGDIVWFKFSSVWWPAEVQDQDTLDEEVTKGLKKRPLAVVKFFDEDSYEFVRNLDQIYFYNCPKKNDFILQGLEKCRPGGHKSIPTCMIKFQPDIVQAEMRTGGNPDILNDPAFLPKEKPDLTDLFPSAAPKYKAKKRSAIRTSYVEDGTPPTKTPVRYEPPASDKVKLSYVYCDVSRSSNLSGPQASNGHSSLYSCDCCPFTTTRLVVIQIHCKSCKPSAPLPFFANSRSSGSSTPRTPKKKKIAQISNIQGSGAKKKAAKPAVKSPGPSEKEIRDDILKDWEDDDEDEESVLISTAEEAPSASELLNVLAGSEEEKEGDDKEKLDNSEEVIIDGTVDEKDLENDLETIKVDEQVVPDSDQVLPSEESKKEDESDNTADNDLADKINELLESTETPKIPAFFESKKKTVDEKKKSDPPEASPEIASSDGQGSTLKKKNAPRTSSPGDRSIAAIKIPENSAVNLESADAATISILPSSDEKSSEGSIISINRDDVGELNDLTVEKKKLEDEHLIENKIIEDLKTSDENVESLEPANVASEADDVGDILQLEKELECIGFSGSPLTEPRGKGDSSFEQDYERCASELSPPSHTKSDLQQSNTSEEPEGSPHFETIQLSPSSSLPPISCEDIVKFETPVKDLSEAPMTRSKKLSPQACLTSLSLGSSRSKSKANRKEIAESEEVKKPKKAKNSLSSSFRRALEEVTRDESEAAVAKEDRPADEPEGNALEIAETDSTPSDVTNTRSSRKKPQPKIPEETTLPIVLVAVEKRTSLRSRKQSSSDAANPPLEDSKKPIEEKEAEPLEIRSLRRGAKVGEEDKEIKKVGLDKKLKTLPSSNDASSEPPSHLRLTRRSLSKGSLSSSEVEDSVKVTDSTAESVTERVASEIDAKSTVKETRTSRRLAGKGKEDETVKSVAVKSQVVQQPKKDEPLPETVQEPEKETRVSRRLKGEAALVVKVSTPRAVKLKDQDKHGSPNKTGNTAADLINLLETDSDKEGKFSAEKTVKSDAKQTRESIVTKESKSEGEGSKSEQVSTPSRRSSRLGSLGHAESKLSKGLNSLQGKSAEHQPQSKVEVIKESPSSELVDVQVRRSHRHSVIAVDEQQVVKESEPEAKEDDEVKEITEAVPEDVIVVQPKKKGRPRKQPVDSVTDKTPEPSKALSESRVTRSRGSQDSVKTPEVALLKLDANDVKKEEEIENKGGRSRKQKPIVSSEAKSESMGNAQLTDVDSAKKVDEMKTPKGGRLRKQKLSTSVSEVSPIAVDNAQLTPEVNEAKMEDEVTPAAKKGGRPRKRLPSTLEPSKVTSSQAEVVVGNAQVTLEVSDAKKEDEVTKTPTVNKGGRPRKQKLSTSVSEVFSAQAKPVDNAQLTPEVSEAKKKDEVTPAVKKGGRSSKRLPSTPESSKVSPSQAHPEVDVGNTQLISSVSKDENVKEIVKTPTTNKGGRPRKRVLSGETTESPTDICSTPASYRLGALTRSSDSKRAPLVAEDAPKTPSATLKKKMDTKTSKSETESPTVDNEIDSDLTSGEHEVALEDVTITTKESVKKKVCRSKKKIPLTGIVLSNALKLSKAASQSINESLPESKQLESKGEEEITKDRQLKEKTKEETTKNQPMKLEEEVKSVALSASTKSDKIAEEDVEASCPRLRKDGKLTAQETAKKDAVHSSPKKKIDKEHEAVKEVKQSVGDIKRIPSDLNLSEVGIGDESKNKDDLALKRSEDTSKTNKRKPENSSTEIGKKLKTEPPSTPPVRIIEEIDMFQEKVKPTVAGTPLKKSDPSSIKKNIEHSKKTKTNISIQRSSRTSKDSTDGHSPVSDSNKAESTNLKKKKKDFEPTQPGKPEPSKDATPGKRKPQEQVVTKSDLPVQTCRATKEPANDMENPSKKIKQDVSKHHSTKEKGSKGDKNKQSSTAVVKRPNETPTAKSTDVSSRKAETPSVVDKEKQTVKKFSKASSATDQPSSPVSTKIVSSPSPVALEPQKSEIQANYVQSSNSLDSLSLTPTKPYPVTSGTVKPPTPTTPKRKPLVSKDPRLPENRAKVEEASILSKKETSRSSTKIEEPPNSATPKPRKPEKGKIKFSSYTERLHAKQAAEEKSKVETRSLTPPLPIETTESCPRVEFKEKTSDQTEDKPQSRFPLVESKPTDSVRNDTYVSTPLTLPPKKGILKNVASSLSFSTAEDVSPSNMVQQIILAAKSTLGKTNDLGIASGPILSTSSLIKDPPVNPPPILETSKVLGKEMSSPSITPTTTPPKPPPKLNDITSSEIDSVPESLKEDFLGFLSEKSLLDITKTSVQTTSTSNLVGTAPELPKAKDSPSKDALASVLSLSDDLELPKRRKDPDDLEGPLKTKLPARVPKVIKFSENCFESLSKKEPLLSPRRENVAPSTPDSPRTPPLPPPASSETSPMRPKSRWSQSAATPIVEHLNIPEKIVETCTKKSRVHVEVHWGTKTSPVKKPGESREKSELVDIKRKLSTETVELDEASAPKMSRIELPSEMVPELPPVPPEDAPELPPVPPEEPPLTPPPPVPSETIGENLPSLPPTVCSTLTTEKSISAFRGSEEHLFSSHSPEPPSVPPLWIDDVASIPLPPEPAPPTAKSPIWTAPIQDKDVEIPLAPVDHMKELSEAPVVENEKKEIPGQVGDAAQIEIDLDEIPIPDLPSKSPPSVKETHAEEKVETSLLEHAVEVDIEPVREEVVVEDLEEVIIETKEEIIVEDQEEVVVEDKDEVVVESTKDAVKNEEDKTDIYEEVVYEDQSFEEVIIENPNDWEMSGENEIVIGGEAETAAKPPPEVIAKDQPKMEQPQPVATTFDAMGMDFDINSMPVVYVDEFLSDLNTCVDGTPTSLNMPMLFSSQAPPVSTTEVVVPSSSDIQDSPASPDPVPVSKSKRKGPIVENMFIIIRKKTGEVADNIFDIPPPRRALRPDDRLSSSKESSHRRHSGHRRHHSSSTHGSRHSHHHLSRSSLTSSGYRSEGSVDRSASKVPIPPGKLFIVANTSTGSGPRSVTTTPPRIASVKGQLPPLDKQSSKITIPPVLKTQPKPGTSTLSQSLVKGPSTKIPTVASKAIIKPKNVSTVQLVASKQGGPPKMVIMSSDKSLTLGSLIMNPSTTSSNQSNMVFVPSTRSSTDLSNLMTQTPRHKVVVKNTKNSAKKPDPVKKPVPIQSNVTKKVTLNISNVIPQKPVNAPIMLELQPESSEPSIAPVTVSMSQSSVERNNELLYLSMDGPNSSILTIDGVTQKTFLQKTNQTNNLIILDNSDRVDPQSSTMSVNENEDILAKALANTQVLQSDISDVQSLENAPIYIDQQYPIASLSHDVLETSLTLNQPIMTPIEQPSIAQSTSSNSTVASQLSILNESDLSESTMFLTSSPVGGQQPHSTYQVITSSTSTPSNQTQLIIAASPVTGNNVSPNQLPTSPLILGNLESGAISQVQPKLQPLVSISPKSKPLTSIHLPPESVTARALVSAVPPSSIDQR